MIGSAWKVWIDGEYVGLVVGLRWHDAHLNAAAKYNVAKERIHVALAEP